MTLFLRICHTLEFNEDKEIKQENHSIMNQLRHRFGYIFYTWGLVVIWRSYGHCKITGSDYFLVFVAFTAPKWGVFRSSPVFAHPITPSNCHWSSSVKYAFGRFSQPLHGAVLCVFLLLIPIEFQCVTYALKYSHSVHAICYSDELQLKMTCRGRATLNPPLSKCHLHLRTIVNIDRATVLLFTVALKTAMHFIWPPL